MLSLALVVAFAGMARGSYDSIQGWMTTALNPDLFVAPSQTIVIRTIRFPASMYGELTGVAGVQRVQAVRDARIVFRKTPIMVVAVDVKSVSETARRKPIAGDEDDMYRRTAAGEAVMVSENLAQLQRLQLGQVLEVPAYGTIGCRLPASCWTTRSAGHDPDGHEAVPEVLARRHVNIFRVYLQPGVPMPECASAFSKSAGSARCSC
jgi:hypothetical protein